MKFPNPFRRTKGFINRQSRPISRRRIFVLIAALGLAVLATILQQKYLIARAPEMAPAIVAKTTIEQSEGFTTDNLMSANVPVELIKGAAEPSDLKGAVARGTIESGSVIYKSMLAPKPEFTDKQRLVNVNVTISTIALEIVPNETKVDVIFIPAGTDEKSTKTLDSLLKDSGKPQVILTDVLVLDVLNASTGSLFKRYKGHYRSGARRCYPALRRRASSAG